MQKIKKEKGILYINKQKLDLYVVGMTNPVSFPFPPNVVRNIELIDKNQLMTQLHAFLRTNKIIPASFSLILDESILFEKTFPLASQKTVKAPDGKTPPATPQQGGTPTSGKSAPVQPATPQQPVVQVSEEEREKSMQQFIDSIPFEEVVTKRINSQAGTTIIGTNKALLSALREIFEKVDHSIDMIYPASAFGKAANLSNGLTLQIAQSLLPKVDTLHSQNMVLEEKIFQPVSPLSQPLAMPQKESDKKRLILLSGVFGLLMVLMVGVYFYMNAQYAEEDRRNALARQAKKPTATATPTPTTIAAPVITKESIAIQITSNSSGGIRSRQLEQLLQGAGYSQISLQTGSSTINRALISFSTSVPQQFRDEISQQVSSVSAQFSVQENTSSESAVTITL